MDTGDRGGIMRQRPVVGKAAVPDAVRRLLDKFDYPDRESPTQVVPILPALGGGGGVGAFVHLSRNATQSIAAAGEAISWDLLGLLASEGWGLTPLGTEITIPISGYYNIAVLAGWSSFTDGGNVAVRRTRGENTVTVWPPAADPGLWTATDGTLFEGTAHAIACLASDVLTVIIDPDDASAQTLASATVAVYLVDTTNLIVSGYREMVLADGPVAYWRLGEASTSDSALDETGNGHDGTYTTGVVLGGAGVLQGDPDTSALFDEATSDGVDVTITSALKLLTSDYTLEAWVRITASMSGIRYVLSYTDTAPSLWGIAIEESGGSFRFRSPRNGVFIADTGYDFAQDIWYHIVVTYDVTTDDMFLYVDTVEEATGTSAGTISDEPNPVRIGRNEGTGVDADIDEVAVYARVLTTAEIAEHYRVGTQGG